MASPAGRARSRLIALAALSVAAVAATVAGPARPGAASFPGQNGKIAFARQPLVIPQSTVVGGKDLFVMGPDGSNPVALDAANSPSDEADPAWSADGARLAFSSTRSGNAEIYTANEDGTGAALHTTHPGGGTVPAPADRQPAWSPAGDRIVFTRGTNLAVMTATGTGRVPLTSDVGTDNQNPSWSPDGRRIAFQRRVGNQSVSDIWTVNPDGSDPRNLTQSGFDETEPSWSPDGTRIAYARDFDIYVMDADGSNVTPVTDDRGLNLEREPAWSPDGTRIAFRAEVGDSGAPAIHVIAPNGTGRVELTKPAPASDLEPDWQPLPLGVAVSPGGLDFGEVTLGATSAPQSVTVTSIGRGVVQMAAVALGGANPLDFLQGADGCSGRSLPPGASCQIEYRFRPTAVGGRSGAVTITDNAPGSPRGAGLRGRGVEPTTITTGTTVTVPPPPPPPPPPAAPASLELVPPIGPPGFVTLAVGSGFPAGTTVRLRWEPGIGETAAVTDAAGTFRVPVLVFHRDRLGPRQLVATLAAGPPFAPDPLPAPFLVVAPTIQPGDFVLRR